MITVAIVVAVVVVGGTEMCNVLTALALDANRQFDCASIHVPFKSIHS